MRHTYLENKVQNTIKASGALAWIILLVVVPIAAWVTHVVVTIQAGAYLLLAIGGFLVPIGVIHGLMIWFGVPWTA